MAARSANVSCRVEPELKMQAEAILERLGVSQSALINMTYRQVVLHQGIPFSVTLPSKLKARDEMSSAEFNEMMSISLAQAKNDEAVSLDEAFDDLLQGL